MRRVENCEKKMIDDSEQPANVNKAILDEVNAAAAWFHANVPPSSAWRCTSAERQRPSLPKPCPD